uniref:BTB domain-containing protein n=1 Tax=Panagrellus redivivus TaxID=6233 RepID=A0A7E4UL41_PANRE
MSFTKLIMVHKDSISFTLNETDLTGMQVGKKLKTPQRDVPRSDGLKWWIEYYPAGINQSYSHHLSVLVNMNKAVSAKCKFEVGRSSMHKFYTYNIVDTQCYAFRQFASHWALSLFFVEGKISVTCEVEFTLPMPITFVKPCYGQFCDHVLTDFALVVDSERVEVHKSLLSLMSPVFHALLSNNTDESEIEIKDFDFATVKAAIDFCYGREPETVPIDTVFNMLYFAEQYDIKAVTNLMNEMPEFCISTHTFIAIIQYADKFCKDGVFDECCKFFEKHQKEIVKMKKFDTLSLLLVKRLLKQAFGLKTEFEVLRHAHTYGITFILGPLEQPIFESLSLDTFCNSVSYAWECSRDYLKPACAKFFNEHVADIVNMNAFVNLSPSIVQKLMQLRYELLLENQIQLPSQPINQSLISIIYTSITKSIAKLFSKKQ